LFSRRTDTEMQSIAWAEKRYSYQITRPTSRTRAGFEFGNGLHLHIAVRSNVNDVNLGRLPLTAQVNDGPRWLHPRNYRSGVPADLIEADRGSCLRRRNHRVLADLALDALITDRLPRRLMLDMMPSAA
jgi:hypothetical protein